MRIETIRYDVSTEQLVISGSGAAAGTSAWPKIHYKEKILLRITFVDGNNVAIALSADADEFSAALDEDYDYDNPLFAKTLNADINKPGDWIDAGDANPNLGQMSVRLSAYNSSFRKRLSTTESKLSTRLEIQGIHVDGHLVCVYRIPLIAANLMDDGSIFLDELDDGYGEKWVVASDGYNRLAHYFAQDETWRVLMPVIIDGVATHSWEVSE